jgi:hypothetical protein
MMNKELNAETSSNPSSERVKEIKLMINIGTNTM